MLVLASGEEAIGSIKIFAKSQNLSGSSVAGIGAFSTCSFGHFNPLTKAFTRNDLWEQAEVVALTGNIAGDVGEDTEDHDGDEEGDGPHLHIHCVVGLKDATTRGGHLIQGIVSPTMELIIEESPVHLSRGIDRASGLVLLQPNQED